MSFPPPTATRAEIAAWERSSAGTKLRLPTCHACGRHASIAPTTEIRVIMQVDRWKDVIWPVGSLLCALHTTRPASKWEERHCDMARPRVPRAERFHRPIVARANASEQALARLCSTCGARGHTMGDRLCPFSEAPIFDGCAHRPGVNGRSLCGLYQSAGPADPRLVTATRCEILCSACKGKEARSK